MSTPDPGQFAPQWQFHALDIAFDTPNLYTTGVVIFTPSVGDLVMGNGLVSKSTTWDGTTPTLHLLSQGFASVAEELGGTSPAVLSQPDVVGAHTTTPTGQPFPDASIRCTDATPLVVMVDNGAGGAPGCTVGVAQVVLVTAGQAFTLREPVA